MGIGLSFVLAVRSSSGTPGVIVEVAINYDSMILMKFSFPSIFHR